MHLETRVQSYTQKSVEGDRKAGACTAEGIVEGEARTARSAWVHVSKPWRRTTGREHESELQRSSSSLLDSEVGEAARVQRTLQTLQPLTRSKEVVVFQAQRRLRS
eukprot:34461-Amphidinium_carterae.1